MRCARRWAWRPRHGTRPRRYLWEDAGLTLVGHSSLKAALDLDWGSPARPRALGFSPEEVERWQRWLEQQHTLAAQTPPFAGGHGDHHAAYHAGHRASGDPGVDKPGRAMHHSTSHLTGASLSRIKTCATVVKRKVPVGAKHLQRF